ncbi:MAG: chorismate mutase [Alphaproteobacteria bacterium]|nr:chorismate mutase [Alphaproteobacteria bacterium]
MQNDAAEAPDILEGLTNPQDCANMPQLRAAIDALDARLVALLAVRQSYMDRAAVLKTTREQVRDPARIEDVVSKVLAEAQKVGLSPAIAEPVWRTLIEQSIRHEFEAFDRR